MNDRRSIYKAVLLLCVGIPTWGLAQTARSQQKNLKPADVQHGRTIKEETYPWGWIRWMMNDKIDSGAMQTFGIVQINPGQRNSLHLHPNCEELLYVLSGSAENIVGDRKVIVKAGDLIRIPMNTPHQAIVIGKEPLRAVISYSSGDRQVVNLGSGKE